MHHQKPFFITILLVLFLLLSASLKANPEKDKTPPNQPILVHPPNQSTGNPTGVTLSEIVSEPDADNLTVTFYGRRKLSTADDFTIVGLPDTQYYTGQLYNGTPDIFYSQTQWIVDNKDAENIVFVSQLGDCVENGDQVEDEWKIADTAMKTIEDSIATLLTDGVPYALAVGNHDQSPWGDPNGTTDLYNAWFGESRFLGRQYYGGHYGENNDNSFQFSEAGGMDFMVINIEFDPAANMDVLQWADSLLLAHTNRRAIIVSHFLIGPGNPGIFGSQGQAIYDHFKDNSNAFLMLGAHFPGEGQRSDVYNGDTIHTLLADYQMRENGGNGWLRLMKFSPVNNTISVKTYSPWLDEWEQDADSEFTLPYNMNNAGFEEIGTMNNVASGDTAMLEWTNRDPQTEYEWFVEITDGTDTIKGPQWSFTTGDHRLSIKVFLEGPFNEINMNTDLTGNPLLVEGFPLTQPYNTPPWNYNGTESITEIPDNVVDWVLIELRDAPYAASALPSTSLTRQAALLLNDGSIINPNNCSILEFSNSIIHSLFVIVWHRNHLPIMSAHPLSNTAGVFHFDFTTDASMTYGEENGCKALPNNFWGMIAGDGNADGIIDLEDKTSFWSIFAGKSGYLSNDYNLDGQTNNPDKNNFWKNNLMHESQLPE